MCFLGRTEHNPNSLFGPHHDESPDHIVYELTYAKGKGWKETVLHNFIGSPDGEYPESTLVFGSTGALYGATGACGADAGSVSVQPPADTGKCRMQLVARDGTEPPPPAFSGLRSPN